MGRHHQNFLNFREATECITKDAVLQGAENVLEIIPLGLINMLTTEMAIVFLAQEVAENKLRPHTICL